MVCSIWVNVVWGISISMEKSSAFPEKCEVHCTNYLMSSLTYISVHIYRSPLMLHAVYCDGMLPELTYREGAVLINVSEFETFCIPP